MPITFSLNFEFKCGPQCFLILGACIIVLNVLERKLNQHFINTWPLFLNLLLLKMEVACKLLQWNELKLFLYDHKHFTVILCYEAVPISLQ